MIVAVISGASLILAAAISGASGYIRHYLKRYDKALYAAEQRITRLESRDKLWWLYSRQLIDLAYRHNIDPPKPPKGLIDNDEPTTRQ